MKNVSQKVGTLFCEALGSSQGAFGGAPSLGAKPAGVKRTSVEIEPYIPGTNFKKAKAVLKNHKTVKKSGSNMSTADIISLIAEIRGGKG